MIEPIASSPKFWKKLLKFSRHIGGLNNPFLAILPNDCFDFGEAGGFAAIAWDLIAGGKVTDGIAPEISEAIAG